MPRDLRIDTLRGLLLIMITLNHFGFLLPEGWWGQHFTWQPWGYVSAAEGFVFLAGLSFSVFSSRYAGNLPVLRQKARENARRIYSYHLGMSLSIATLFWLIPLYHTAWAEWFAPYPVTPFASAIAITLLLHQPPYLDILPMYAVFLFFSPLAITLLHHRKYSTLFAASIALWFMGQFVHPFEWITNLLFPHHRPGHFNVLSWQLLYVLGLGLGTKDFRTVLTPFFQRPLLLSLFAVCTLLLFLSRHALFVPELTAGIDRPSLQGVRLANFLCLTTLVGVVLSKVPLHVHVPWLAFLGQHSLQVFSFHVVAFYLLLPVTWYIVSTFSLLGFVPFVLIIIAGLWIVAFLHHQYQDIVLAPASPKPTYVTIAKRTSLLLPPHRLFD